jgi:hypothetical protein
MTAIRLLTRLAPVAGFCALLACAPKPESAAPVAATAASQDSAEFEWTRAALAKNPQLQVLAADPDSHVITVRLKKTGEVRALKLNEVAAAPIADLASAEKLPPPPPEPVASTAAPAPESTPTLPAPTAAPSHDPTANYTIQREAGKVKVSGPGVTIESSSGAPPTPQAGASTRRLEPIICDGQRAMYVDGQTVTADGDAVIARNGCELHIANSNIAGSTNGILIENASVHIRNSTVEGGQASFQSVGNAKLYLQNSTFHGASRRSEKTQIDDQGGNVWR